MQMLYPFLYPHSVFLKSHIRTLGIVAREKPTEFSGKNRNVVQI